MRSGFHLGKLSIPFWFAAAVTTGGACGGGDTDITAPEQSAAEDPFSGYSEAYKEVTAPGALALPQTGYQEPLTNKADLSSVASNYQPSSWEQTMADVMALRYETGSYLTEQTPKGMELAALWMQGQTSTFDKLVERMPLVVGELAKHFGKQIASDVGGSTFALVVRDDQTLVIPRIDTPARSEIYSKIDSSVANIYTYYLQGSEGAGDFFDLLAELNAATHGLFTAYGVSDWLPPNTSVTQGEAVLTFMMYVQVYLRHVRENHPAVYAALKAEPEIQDAVTLLWARGLFILNVANSDGILPALPGKVAEKVNDAGALAEITTFTSI